MSSPECSIENCGKPVTARGWCKSHYNHWYNHGDPLAQSDGRMGRWRVDGDQSIEVVARVAAICNTTFEHASRLAHYFAAREQGLEQWDAAAELGLTGTDTTIRRYEKWWTYYQNQSGGAS